jgi:hypothetical protein
MLNIETVASPMFSMQTFSVYSCFKQIIFFRELDETDPIL